MIWSTAATRGADGIVTIARDGEGRPAGVALLDEDGIATQIVSRDVAFAVALKILELGTQLDAA